MHAVFRIRARVWNARQRQLRCESASAKAHDCLEGRPSPGRPSSTVDLVSLRAALSRLPRRLAALIQSRYGLNGAPPLDQATIADRLGLSAQRVSQLEAAALTRLRGLMESGAHPGD